MIENEKMTWTTPVAARTRSKLKSLANYLGRLHAYVLAFGYSCNCLTWNCYRKKKKKKPRNPYACWNIEDLSGTKGVSMETTETPLDYTCVLIQKFIFMATMDIRAVN